MTRLRTELIGPAPGSIRQDAATITGALSAEGLDHYAVGMKDLEGNEFDIKSPQPLAHRGQCVRLALVLLSAALLGHRRRWLKGDWRRLRLPERCLGR